MLGLDIFIPRVGLSISKAILSKTSLSIRADLAISSAIMSIPSKGWSISRQIWSKHGGIEGDSVNIQDGFVIIQDNSVETQGDSINIQDDCIDDGSALGIDYIDTRYFDINYNVTIGDYINHECFL